MKRNDKNLEKCPDCKKYWAMNWRGEEYCPECGQTKAQAIAKAQRSQERAGSLPRTGTHPVLSAQTVNLFTAEQQYAKRLIDRLYQERGYQHHPTVIRNRQTSYCHKVQGKTQIVLGYESLERAVTRSFRDYKTIAWVWSGQGELKGLKGAWALALHEFAHAVQYEEGRLYSKNGHANKYHNEQFVQIVRELQKLYPYDATL